MEFVNFQIKEINYQLDVDINQDDLSFEISSPNISDENIEKIHELEIKIFISDVDENYKRKIELTIVGNFRFESKGDFNNKELQDLIRKNGTAILMPYIRSFVSNITSFDNSTSPILLPTINAFNLVDSTEIEKE